MRLFLNRTAFSGGLYFAFISGGALLGVLKYGIFAKQLDPESFGIYNLVLTSYVYIIYIGGLGLNEAVIKLGAEAHGKKQFDQIFRLRDIAFFYGGIATLACGIVFFLCLTLFVKDTALINSLGLAAVLAFVALEFNLLDAAFRAHQRMLLFSSMLCMKAIVVVVLGKILASHFGVNGVIAAEIAASASLFLIFLIGSKESFKPSRLIGSRPLFVLAVKNGFPLVASMFVRNLSMSLDRWAIAAAIGMAALGKYSFAMLVYLVALTGIAFLTNISGPKWLSEYGQHQDVMRLFKRIKRVVQYVIALAIVSAVPFFLVIKIALVDYYPAYAGNDTFVTTILIYVGVVLLICTYLLDWFFIATSTESLLLKISILTLGMTVAFILIAYTLKWGILFYAAIFLLCRIFTAALYIRSLSWIIARPSSLSG